MFESAITARYGSTCPLTSAQGLLTFAPTTNEAFIQGLCEWQVSIPKGPTGEERTWQQWLVRITQT